MTPNLVKRKKVAERNEKIRRYHQTHPGASIRTIGKMFGIDHSLVSRILNAPVVVPENKS